MKQNLSKFKTAFILTISLLLIPLNVNAANTYTIKETKIWENNLNLPNVKYNTRKGSSSLERQTKFMGGFKITDGASDYKGTRWYCIEPGVALESGNKITGASITTNAPNKSSDSHWTWDIYGVNNLDTDLSYVLSCWYENDYSIISTQSIVWELISRERANINYSKILGGNYKPYEPSGSVFGSRSGVTSMYEIISGSSSALNSYSAKRNKLYKAYKETLACAARFKTTPTSGFYSSSSASGGSKSHPVKVSSYNAKTEKFSKTISSSELNYYKIKSISGLSSSEVSLSNGTLSINTGKEISSSSPATVELELAYITKNGVDGSAHKLRDHGSIKYLVKRKAQSNGKYPQATARGSNTKSVYISFYTGEKPKYQLKVYKKDDSGNPLSGVSFYICSANVISSGSSCNSSNKLATITTGADGTAVKTDIEHIGEYVAVEVSAPSGYVVDSTPQTITVLETNKAGSSSYATSGKTFVNKKMHLKMNKRTLDADGNESTLTGDACSVATCPNEDNRENGPIFEIKQGDKNVCVKETADGKYTYNSISDTCPSGTTNKIKTCNGAFDIELIPAGKYKVTEIATACGTTLPSNPSQDVTVRNGDETTTVTMLNGVTGVVFTKVTENGSLLSGGKFALQKKENGVYKDILLVHKAGAIYEFVSSATTETTNATYMLDTNDGIINVINLPKGEYRFVEKQAPEGYDLIKEKDSTAKVTISDKNTTNEDKTINYYQVKLVNQVTKEEGTSDDAELVVTINTGRKVINYPLAIGGLVVLLVVGIIIRRKFKK